jgi:hypothetical protein
VSHTTGEAPIALALKDFLEGTFAGGLEVFVSGDVLDLTPGDKWLEKIDSVLKTSKVLLVICSPSSLTRPWINFEAGCGWMAGMSIVPICHSGQDRDQLPHPFSELHSLQLEDESFFKSLCAVFCKVLGIVRPLEMDLARWRRSVDKAIEDIRTTEAQPQIINSESERTQLINEDLRRLLGRPGVAHETVWTSAFLSTFALGADDPYPKTSQSYLALLLQEKELLLELARRGCTIKCIISPANKNHVRHAGIDYAIMRTSRLLGFLRGEDRELNSIDWAISELGLRNLYIIGHISCFEGYKTGIHPGYALTLRQSSPDVISANVNLHGGFFRDLAARTLVKWGCVDDPGGQRQLLRAATIRCLEDSKRFLEETRHRMQEQHVDS